MRFIEKKEALPVRRIRGWARLRGISYIELAFRAYQFYSEDRKSLEAKQAQRKTLDKSKETEEIPRRVGPYSFISLLSFYNGRWELIPYLEKARDSFITHMRKVS